MSGAVGSMASTTIAHADGTLIVTSCRSVLTNAGWGRGPRAAVLESTDITVEINCQRQQLVPDMPVPVEVTTDRDNALALLRTRIRPAARCIKIPGSGVLEIYKTLRGDKEVVLAAVTWDGHELLHASEAMKDDRQVVLSAVRSYGWALNDASKALRGDRQVVLAAMVENGSAVECAKGAYAYSLHCVRS